MFPKQPADNYGSNIRTEAPFSQGLIRAAAKVPAAYTGANASRSAFARALSDEASTQTRTQFAMDNAEYQRKAIKARAQDVQGRRESGVKAGGLDTQLTVANETLDTKNRVRTAELDSAYNQSRANIDAFLKRANQDLIFNSIFGAADAMYRPLMKMAEVPQSEQYMAMKAKYGAGPYEGITSGDILAAGGGYRGADARMPYYDMPRLGGGSVLGGLRR